MKKIYSIFTSLIVIITLQFFSFAQGNVGIGTDIPNSRFTIKGDSTDIRMDLNSTSIKTTQDLKFAVDNIERSIIQHDKNTNNLVIDVDKNDQNSGDIVFKKHGDDRLAIRNNGDVLFKRYGDDRLAIRGENGNVGIGTSIPSSRLTIKGNETDIQLNMNLASPAGTQGIMFAVGDIERSSIRLDKTSNNLTLDVDKNGQNTGDIVFKRYGDERLAIRNNGDVLFKRYGDDRLAIRGENGNVGIGTSIPSSRLTIKGEETNIRMDLNLGSPGTTQGIQFAVDGIERGSIQLDKTSNNLTIDVDKNDQNSGDIIFKKHGDDRLAIRNNGDVQFKRYGDDRLAIRGDNGNIGIGTSIPTSKLTIKGDETDIRMDLNLISPGTTQGIQFAVDGIERGSIQLDKISNNLTFDVDKNDQNSGDIVFKKHGDDRLAIRNNGDVVFKRYGDDRLAIRGDNGNVGIGTANPATKLDVTGSVKVANDMTPPTSLNAGAIRYRVEGNSSFCEMVMQIGPIEYAWVVIKQFTW